MAGRQRGVFAINFLLCTATDLWALRYPEPHQLYLLDRRAGAAGRSTCAPTGYTPRRVS